MGWPANRCGEPVRLGNPFKGTTTTAPTDALLHLLPTPCCWLCSPVPPRRLGPASLALPICLSPAPSAPPARGGVVPDDLGGLVRITGRYPEHCR
jgi:hypothetical protein